MTPNELADSLNISPKTLRQWLRDNWPRSTPGAIWDVTPEQARLARERWPANDQTGVAVTAVSSRPLASVEGILTEDEVVDAVADYLARDGWEIVGVAHAHEHGDDITAERDGVRLVVEAKGAGSSKAGTKRFGLRFNHGQVRTHVAVAVLRMLGVTSAGKALAAVALPDNRHHREVFGKAERSLLAAGVGVFWVDDDGRVSGVSLPWDRS
jgi:hypothetical protein